PGTRLFSESPSAVDVLSSDVAMPMPGDPFLPANRLDRTPPQKHGTDPVASMSTLKPPTVPSECLLGSSGLGLKATCLSDLTTAGPKPISSGHCDVDGKLGSGDKESSSPSTIPSSSVSTIPSAGVRFGFNRRRVYCSKKGPVQAKSVCRARHSIPKQAVVAAGTSMARPIDTVSAVSGAVSPDKEENYHDPRSEEQEHLEGNPFTRADKLARTPPLEERSYVVERGYRSSSELVDDVTDLGTG
ncbi:unnamed protein product, partial [Choristocarpus tenellus]